ncbi:TPA: hypothetical protein ACYZ29_004517, partial [Escherichia coli]
MNAHFSRQNCKIAST